MVIPKLFGAKTPTHPHKPIYPFNTLSKEKEEFSPIIHGKVRMYNCGPTVYARQHIGNFRSFVLADVLLRMFMYNGYEVKQVMNITDVGHLTSDADEGEDKLEKQAQAEGEKVSTIAQKVTEQFFEDLKILNAYNPHNPFPKASAHIPEQIAFIKTLEEKGYTYKISDGIYFDTARFKEYGKLGNINLEGLEEGSRVEVNKEKINHTDFALWKFSKPEDNRRQEWNSPWGVGFPGWHIECSALVMKFLGKRIDVHTGGIDHIPTHHNNEIAQTESITGDTFSKYWVHGAHLMLEGKKISKSEGRCVYIYNITDRGIPALAFRYWLLTGHYSTQVNFTWDALEAAQSGYIKLMRYFVEKLGAKNGTVIPEYQEKFQGYINDDLDTPKAIALLHEIMRDETKDKADIRATFLDFDKVLGLGLREANKKLIENLSGRKKVKVSDIPEEVQALLTARETARSEKNFEESDRLRDEISKFGYTVVDGPKNTTVTKNI